MDIEKFFQDTLENRIERLEKKNKANESNILRMLKHLKVYAGSDHPHGAQTPKNLEI